MPLENIIRRDVISISVNGTMKEAANLMHQNHVGMIVVLGKSHGIRKIPVGILTDRDIVKSIAQSDNFNPNCLVADIMNPNIFMCGPDDGIYDTIRKMNKNGIRRIPVVNKKENLVGIVASDDLIKLLSEELSELSQIIPNNSDIKRDVSKISETQKRVGKSHTRPVSSRSILFK
ncbi:MAG: CBS domain-containing protein [Bacteriovoracaceae bacterium]|jgi:CBS domain-containing protein|nr:CBS domain-containing protein [Bacteriovoracaceae bacterium]